MTIGLRRVWTLVRTRIREVIGRTEEFHVSLSCVCSGAQRVISGRRSQGVIVISQRIIGGGGHWASVTVSVHSVRCAAITHHDTSTRECERRTYLAHVAMRAYDKSKKSLYLLSFTAEGFYFSLAISRFPSDVSSPFTPWRPCTRTKASLGSRSCATLCSSSSWREFPQGLRYE